MNIKDEHTSRLWTFIMKGEIMDLDDDELIATRINNKTASWKEVEEYIEKYYVKKDKIKEQKRHYENKCAVLERGANASQCYEMGKNFGAFYVLEELLGE